MSGWNVPGYDVEQLLGTGTTGQVWRAREITTGAVVAVKLLPADGDPDAAERLRADLDLLAGVRHPHLVPVRAVLAVADGVAVVSDFAPGGSLASLLAERGSLEPGEIVTVGVPLASALAALHAHGLVHGAVTPANVLFTGDGRPLLSDSGLAVLVGSSASSADDVQALGAVLAEALDRGAPAALRGCVDRALAAGPAGGPTAGELASDLRSTGSPAPVRLRRPAEHLSRAGVRPRGSTAGEGEAPARPVTGKPARPPLALLAGLPLTVVAAVLAGRAWAAADRPAAPPSLSSVALATSRPPAPATARPSPSAAPTVASTPASVNWSSTLVTLDARRNAALANLDTIALAEVYAAGSAPLAADAASIRRLAAAGARPYGLRLELVSASLIRDTPARVMLRVVDRLPAYELIGRDGHLLERRTGRGPATWRVDLVPAGDGWRIAAIAPA